MFVALLLLAIPAFWPNYLSQPARSVDRYTHLHAVVAFTWCLLLIVQPFLVARGWRPWHRRLGRAAWVLGPALCLSAVWLANQRFRAMPPEAFTRNATSLYLPLSAVPMFGVPLWLALRHRREVALHARFMIATGLVMVDPVLGRAIAFYLPPLPNDLLYQAITFSLELAILAWLAWRPPLTVAQRGTYLRGVAIFPVIHLGWFTLAQSPAWVPFATWFRSLPLTP